MKLHRNEVILESDEQTALGQTVDRVAAAAIAGAWRSATNQAAAELEAFNPATLEPMVVVMPIGAMVIPGSGYYAFKRLNQTSECLSQMGHTAQAIGMETLSAPAE